MHDGSSSDSPLGVSAFLEAMSEVLTDSFGRSHQHWIRGEVTKVYEKRHLYIDVKDASGDDAVLKVKCWESVWSPIKAQLASQGASLKTGSVINFLGYVDVYKPRGEVSVTITKVDVHAMLGDAALRLQELIKTLQAEGVMDAQRQLAVPPMPLRVGLVASPNTEGYKDFLGQLDRSGMAFTVDVVPTLVQGDAAPPAIAAAITALSRGNYDVICVIRGGGSKADLACFDDERVARAIGASPIVVMTGIGHTGDTSVADMVAFHAAVTPTDLGGTLATRARDAYAQFVEQPAERLRAATAEILADATQMLHSARREVLSSARGRLSVEQKSLAHRGSAMVRAVRTTLVGASEWLSATQQLFAAYDPQRRLAQGWSITTDANGRVVRSVNDVVVGDEVLVRVSDGALQSQIKEKKGNHHG